MIYLIIALVAAVGLAAYLGWNNAAMRQRIDQLEARCDALLDDSRQLRNLQHICKTREAEVRRLRNRMASYESDYQAMETKASELNVSLFRESGLRILAEKEDGAKRLKMEQLEKQLDAAQAKTRQAEAAAQEREKALREQIEQLEAEIARLQTVNARRLARRAQAETQLLNQVSLDDIMGGSGGE